MSSYHIKAVQQQIYHAVRTAVVTLHSAHSSSQQQYGQQEWETYYEVLKPKPSYTVYECTLSILVLVWYVDHSCCTRTAVLYSYTTL